MAISIKPLEDRIVVQTLEAEQTTASGLVIPDTAKEKPQEGKVLAVGPGRVDDSGKRIPIDVAEGDVVIYSKYGGTEIKYQGEDYLILSARPGPTASAAVRPPRTGPSGLRRPVDLGDAAPGARSGCAAPPRSGRPTRRRARGWPGRARGN